MKSFPALLLACFLGAGGMGANAQTLTLEDKLAAIRKSLVEVALEGPTKVTSTQWVDAQGALHESSSFRSGVEVRGVRVLGYGKDEQGETTAKLQWDELYGSKAPKNTAEVKKTEPTCKPMGGGRLQHVLGLQWNIGSRFGSDEKPLVEALRADVLQQISNTGATAALWRVTDMPQSAKRNSYEQALLGSGLDELPWRLEVSAKPLQRPESSNPVWPNLGSGSITDSLPGDENKRTMARTLWPTNTPTTVQVELELRLVARNQSKPVMQGSTTITLQAQDTNWGMQQLSSASRTAALQQAENISLQIYRTLLCQPIVGEVTQAQGKQFRINLGATSGVRIGDTWLLADAVKVPGRVLEAGNAGQTVMAKVQYVGEHYAQLVPSAGPGDKVQTRWAAWSADEAR